MSTSTWSDSDTARALEIWADYQQQHDVSDHIGQTAGIDPISGRVWFGESAQEIAQQMEADAASAPFYAVRVGSEFYLRKGGRR